MSKTRPGRLFELVGGHAALDLVNTLDWRFRKSGPDELLAGYNDLVDFAAQAELMTPKQATQLVHAWSGAQGDRVLDGARALREALSELAYATIDGRNPSDPSLPILEKFFQATHAQTRLARDGRGLKWVWVSGAETKAEFPLWLLARSASRLMFSGDVNLIRACGNQECRWLFLDTSKNHTRRWCDMKICGNRVKARRFRASHSSD
jgi:predicted RNA-binding Zn ribbon-like protein